jgi:4-amino-4-deoxy-L-arabinose transferase-like glycosyltransferase
MYVWHVALLTGTMSISMPEIEVLKKMALFKRQKSFAPVIVVFCLALLVRLIYNLTVAQGYTAIYDASLYDILGHNLVNFHCYCLYPPLPNVSRPPLWPFILAGIDLFAGKNEFYLRLFYCFLGSGTCVLVYLFARNLFGSRIALITGIIAAIYTGLFIWDGWLYTESLYDFCLTAFAYSLFRLQVSAPQQMSMRNGSENTSSAFQSARQWKDRWRWVIACGILLGLLSLTRPNGPILLGPLFLWALIMAYIKILPLRIAMQNALIIGCIGMLILAPWTYRNYAVTDRFLLVSTGLGEVLKGAYSNAVVSGRPNLRGMWRASRNEGLPYNHDSIHYTPQDDAIDTQAALTWIRTHPGDVPYLLMLHFTNTWIPYTYSHGLPMEEFPRRLSSQILRAMIPLMSYPIFILTALGLLLTWRRRKKELLVVYLVIVFIMVQNIVFYSNMRFRAPLEPFLVLLAGGALWGLNRLRNRIPGRGKNHVQEVGAEPVGARG